ncbi:MAG TPA: hypothetical protein VKE69_02875 [Planctomycetota bacterium]|nr:hypothetical protein [Planctomycetota bacterium]
MRTIAALALAGASCRMPLPQQPKLTLAGAPRPVEGAADARALAPSGWSFELAGEVGRRRLVARSGDRASFPISPEAEDATVFDAAGAGREAVVAWCARDGDRCALRVAMVDAAGEVRATRVALDPDLKVARAPSICAIGKGMEETWVVACEVAARESSPAAVLLVRVARSGGGLRSGVPKRAAPSLATSAEPGLAGTSSQALLTFVGERREEPRGRWIFAMLLDDLGDQEAQPAAIVPCAEGATARGRAAPTRDGGRWAIEWDESGSGRAPVRVIAPLAVE